MRLVSGKCLKGIRRVSGKCPEGVLRVDEGGLEGVWNKNPHQISTRRIGLVCLDVVCKVSGRCLNVI